MLGNIGCSPLPNPFSYSNKNISQTKAASSLYGIPKFNELKGTCDPALECIVFRL